MWTMGNLHLIAVILITLCHKVTEGKVKSLDMAPDAVDDMYDGCREQAWDKFIDSGLLGQEMDKYAVFREAQSSANQCWKTGKKENHTVALMTYTKADEKFRNTFSDAVETLGVNVSTYKNQFHFKSLHFLLMDSMTYSPNNCKTFYALPEETYTAVKGAKVRFGRFLQVYPNITDIGIDLDDQNLLKITSCFFVELRPYFCSDDNSALLSPAEVFTVEDVSQKADKGNDATYTEITLKHSAMNSTRNCFMLPRPTGVSTHLHPTPLVLVLVALSLSFCN